MAPDIVMHHTVSPTPVSGRDAVWGILSAFRAGFPDFKAVVEDIVGEDDKVVVRWRISSTHTAKLFETPLTGKSINVAGISIPRLVNGKIVQDWAAQDSLGMMKQLGFVQG